MKQTIFILTFILFAFTSCSTDNKTSTDARTTETAQKENSENDFEKYLKTLEQIPLPFSHHSFEPLESLSKNYDKKTFEKYKHMKSNQPLGILFNDSHTVTLIDFSIGQLGIGPFLITYDKQGNRIDSLVPYQRTRSAIKNNTIYIAREYLTINENKTILVVDSVKTYSLIPRNSDFNDKSGKVTTVVTKYIIEANGHIRENK